METQTTFAQDLIIENEIRQNNNLLANRLARPTIALTQNQFFKLVCDNMKVSQIVTIYCETSYTRGKGLLVKSRLNKELTLEKFFEDNGIVAPIKKGYSKNFPWGADYASMVNRQAAREGKEQDFESAGYQSGLVTVNKYFCQYKDDPARLYFRANIPPKFPLEGMSVYLDANGKKIEGDILERLKKEFMKLESESRQENEVKIFHFTPLLCNTKFVVMGGLGNHAGQKVVYELLS